MKKFVIGDIHGNYKELNELLSKINPDFNNDELIFLGDYIDRGPDSYHVIQLLITLQKRYGENHIILLRGNHEQMAINNINSGCIDYNNGYDATYEDFTRNNDSIENYLELFNSLPLYYEDDNFIYVHGGIRPGISLKKQKDNDLLWIREEFYESSIKFNKTVIFGHTPTIYINNKWDPYIKSDRIGIDTGLAYGGHLTSLEIEDGKIIKIYQTAKFAA
jgi:serine/threonine protein phosphatase 1